MLLHVLETRSTQPRTAEPRLVIEHREALIYMICEAAELEHGLMCEYLFAAFSLKNRVGEGVSEDQLQAIQRWRSTVSGCGRPGDAAPRPDGQHVDRPGRVPAPVAAQPAPACPALPGRGAPGPPAVR